MLRRSKSRLSLRRLFYQLLRLLLLRRLPLSSLPPMFCRPHFRFQLEFPLDLCQNRKKKSSHPWRLPLLRALLPPARQLHLVPATCLTTWSGSRSPSAAACPTHPVACLLGPPNITGSPPSTTSSNSPPIGGPRPRLIQLAPTISPARPSLPSPKTSAHQPSIPKTSARSKLKPPIQPTHPSQSTSQPKAQPLASPPINPQSQPAQPQAHPWILFKSLAHHPFPNPPNFYPIRVDPHRVDPTPIKPTSFFRVAPIRIDPTPTWVDPTTQTRFNPSRFNPKPKSRYLPRDLKNPF